LTVARRYKRRCWWADVDELCHEAVVAIMQAIPRWDAEVGVPIQAYVWRAAIFACKHYLWRNSTPVSETHHRRGDLRDVRRAELHDDHASSENVELSVIEQDWRLRVKAQLELIISDTPNGDLAAAVLLEERSPKECAEDGNVSAVYRAASILRNRIRSSYPVYGLWKEMKQ